MPTAPPTIPPDDPKRNLKLAQPDNPPHVGLVGDTYTITVTGEDTNGRFCVIDMHIPSGGGPPPHRHDFEETFILLGCARGRHTENPCQRSHQFSQRFHGAGAQEKFFMKVDEGRLRADTRSTQARQGSSPDGRDCPLRRSQAGSGRTPR